jgi:DNA-binding PadR family transcriptional regulator
MFAKFASNILNDLSNECLVKSLVEPSEENRQIYANLAKKIDWLVSNVEKLEKKDRIKS